MLQELVAGSGVTKNTLRGGKKYVLQDLPWTLGKLLTLSEPQFLHRSKGKMVSIPIT